MKLYTIGFTKSTAERFFERLATSGVERVVDVRLRPRSQLAGFAKQGDLRYFLQTICGIDYEHRPELTPTRELFEAAKSQRISWSTYQDSFLAIMRYRGVEDVVTSENLDQACLLCSEPDAAHCHRRLVAEYLHSRWGDVQIAHL